MRMQSEALRALTLVAAIFASSLPEPLQAQFACTTNNGTIAITGYSGPGGDVTIPDTIGGLPVTSIADAAFQNQTTLNVVTIPNSVTNLGAMAFEGCIWLFGVNLPTNFPSIGDLTFNQCFQLVGIDLPNTVTNIGYSAFGSCSSLREIAIPDSVKNIAGSAFDNCWRLGKVLIGNGTEFIGSFAFAKCVVLTNLVIGSSVTNIDEYAFESCSNLPMVVFPPKLNFLGYNAFAYSGLKAIYFLGNAVTNLPPGSFSMPDGNGQIYYLPGTSGWGPTYQYHPTMLWNPQIEMNRRPLGAESNRFGFRITGSTNLPVVVEACTNLFAPIWQPVATNILADGAADFSDPDSPNLQSRFYRLAGAVPGDYDFIVTNDTVTLTKYSGLGGNLVIPSTLDGLPVTSIYPNFYSDQNIVTLSIPESVTNIGQLAFSGSPSLTSVTIAAGDVGDWAFAGCASLTNVVFGNGVGTIEEGAFQQCDSLRSIEISSSVTNITIDSQYGAFGGCINLTNISVDAGNPVYASMDGVLFDKNLTTLIKIPQDRHGSYAIPNGVTRIGNRAFEYCQLTNVSFPNSLRDIGDSAFYYSLGLTNIVIPDAVTNIGSNAFGWDYIQSLVLGNSLVEIGDEAFMGCNGLTNVTIPDSVINVDASAFASCSSLSNLTFGLNVSQIGANAFASCPLTIVTLPAALTNLGPQAFASSTVQAINVDPSNLAYSSADGVVFNSEKTELVMFPLAKQGAYQVPDGVAKIREYAFYGSSVTNVTMPASLVEIGTNAFSSSLLGSVTIPDGVKRIDEWAFAYSAVRYAMIGAGVTNIEDGAFISSSITNVVVGQNVARLGSAAFGYCFRLQTAYFNGNAPASYGDTFDDDPYALTIYYRQETSGWGPYFDGRPITVWTP